MIKPKFIFTQEIEIQKTQFEVGYYIQYLRYRKQVLDF